MHCKIVQDLLPLYHDGACSSESRTAVEAHLKDCGDCRAYLEAMDAPLPAERPDGGVTALGSVSHAWRRGKRRAWLKGAALAVLVCAVLFCGWYGLTRWNVRPVPMERMAVTNVRQLSDGRVLFHLYVDDGYTLNEVRYHYDADGSQYLIPLRPVLCAKRQMAIGLFNSDYLLDVAETNAWEQNRGDGTVIRQVFLGSGGDKLLLWEDGMALPAASPEDEAAYGYEPGSADYWTERNMEQTG